jgi:hypothetical protein
MAWGLVFRDLEGGRSLAPGSGFSMDFIFEAGSVKGKKT